MATWVAVSSSKPARWATCSAVSSSLLTLSSEDSSVKLTRLVVGSATAILTGFPCQSSPADDSNDGSVLADLWNVKADRYVFFCKIASHACGDPQPLRWATMRIRG